MEGMPPQEQLPPPPPPQPILVDAEGQEPPLDAVIQEDEQGQLFYELETE